MYGYATTGLIIFLTHPGVAYTFFEPGIFSGMFQAVVIWLLQSVSEGRQSQAATFEILYWIAFGLWAYVKVKLALASR